MSQQKNTWVENHALRDLYEVGRLLTFVSYEVEEIAAVPADTFAPGDVLVVLPENACGQGIDVRRLVDGVADMVWPTEVTHWPPRAR